MPHWANEKDVFKMSIFDEKTCAELAKTLTAMCVRNAEIENIHAGKPIATKTEPTST